MILNKACYCSKYRNVGYPLDLYLFLTVFRRAEEYKRSFTWNWKDLLYFFCFYLFFLLFFPGTVFFLISRDIETIFCTFYWLLKVMVLNDPLLDKSRNLQSYCPCVRMACYRYSFNTIRYRDLELLPMFSLHLKGSSIYSYRKNLRPSSGSHPLAR